VAATSAALNAPFDAAFDSAGNLYIPDFANHRVRRVDAATGVISTIAGTGTAGFSGDGGPATAARLNGPVSVVVDGSGNLYITDANNFRIRRVNLATGVISTIAGNGSNSTSGDGGAATAAALNEARGIALDGAGNLLIAAGVIRRVNLQAGTISSIVRGQGFAGDGGSASSALVNARTNITSLTKSPRASAGSTRRATSVR
jgi:sugar lactone lactonase YvrE